MTDLPHPLEKYLLDNYGFDRDRLERLGLFLLGHLLMDQRLIAAVAADMVKKGSGSYANLSLAEWQDIVALAAERTFLRHLNEAKARNVIPDRILPIAEDANRGRDTFMHFGPTKAMLPQYKGLDVTTPEGLRVFLDDLLDFLNAMPFPLI